ncbi:triacylglycerol lipase [Cyanobium sp. NIES-981]|uniref:esterase/lipase family protein n=1 Tax=Cyanobium sp. NIES-981 TaxID=1851505 RepID=UPI0007DD2DEC|nr:alpha/beta fold hydrolase [Cyanobium sp. NIES-981]SBO41877.1 Lipase family protein [Cyanobium sp. NIES-981]
MKDRGGSGRGESRTSGRDDTPLVLVHGLWDTPRIFEPLTRHLAGRRQPLLAPHLPHGLGQVPLDAMAGQLAEHLAAAVAPNQPIDLLGFSMGGVVARIWIQRLGGHRRTRRFISVGSPHHGSLNALLWPRWLLPGIADMRCGSELLRQLNREHRTLEQVDCCSFYTPMDLMVTPGWRAVLPCGRRERLPVWTHEQLIRSPISLERLCHELLRP